MLQFRCTAAVQKEFGLKPKDLDEIKEADTVLGNWYVNIATIDRRKTFLFVNERTLLSFILPGINQYNIANMHETFLKALNQLLLNEGVDYTLINNLNNEYFSLQHTKTDSKKILGNMNDLMSLYNHIIYSDGGLKYCDLTNTIHRINTTPQRNIGWGNSIDLAKELLHRKKST